MNDSEPLVDRVRVMVSDARSSFAGHPAVEADLEAIAGRLGGPLRLAVAGRVKAGKSTLLNALVGERLAPTDAGECTRIVTWFQEGLAYGVRARLRDGGEQPLAFQRTDGPLDIDVGAVDIEMIDRLVVDWPSSALRTATLIDTPGLSSLDDTASARTRDFLALDGSEADAVIYLMRHLHRRDAEFLDAFKDRSLSNVSPVNAIVVLSRADEIAAGRLDAMTSAARIAQRYGGDPRLRALCLGVVPVAGLVAETGLTFREEEAAALRQLAALAATELDALLLSVDRFTSRDAAVPAPVRAELLRRLGLFGVRFAVDRIQRGVATTAAELSRQLVDVSGLSELRHIIERHFLPRASALKARSAIAALRHVARQLAATDPDGARRLTADIERCEASAHEFAELRLIHLVSAGLVSFTEAEVLEMRRLTGPGPLADRLGVDAGAGASAVQTAALGGVERWRTRAASPMADPALREAAEVMARSFEGAYLASREMAS